MTKPYARGVHATPEALRAALVAAWSATPEAERGEQRRIELAAENNVSLSTVRRTLAKERVA